jgi:hypothetical protein
MNELQYPHLLKKKKKGLVMLHLKVYSECWKNTVIPQYLWEIGFKVSGISKSKTLKSLI